MSEFVAYYSRWRLLLLLALSVGFVLLGLMLAGTLGEIQGLVGDVQRLNPKRPKWVDSDRQVTVIPA